MVARLLIALALSLFWAGAAFSWTLSNFTELNDNGGGGFTTMSGTINIANTGDLVIITLPGNCSTATCTVAYSTALDFSAASVGSTSCSHVVNATGTTNFQGNSLWKCENVAAGSAESVSVTFNQTIVFPTVHVADWSGGATSNSSEGANSFSDAGGTSSSPISIATSGTIHGGDLVISSQAGASSVSVGGCCTTVQSGGGQPNATEYSIATTTSQTNTWTFTGGTTHVSMVIAAFLPRCAIGQSLMLTGAGC